MLQALEVFDGKLAALRQDFLNTMKPIGRGPLEVDLVFVALRDDLVIGCGDELLWRIVSSWQFRKRKPSFPLVTPRASGNGEQT